MKKSTRKYQQRWRKIRNDTANWRALWLDVNEHLLPRRGAFLSSDNEELGKGEKKGEKVINTHPFISRRTLASGLMGGLTSPSVQWFKLAFRDRELNESKPAATWLNSIERGMTTVFAKSNLYGAMRQMYGELASFGFNAMLIEEDPETVIRCRPTTIGECYVTLNSQNRPDTLFRKQWLTVEQLVEKFGEKDVPEIVRTQWKNKKFDEKHEVYHVIEPRRVRDPKDPGPRNMPYASIWFMDSGEDGHLLRESGYRSMPFVAPRWDTIGNDVYGDSPGIESLADIKQLQKMEEDKLMGLDKQVNPPLTAPTSMKGKAVDLRPRAINYLDVQQGQQGLLPTIQVNPDLNGLAMEIERLQQRIDQHFYVPLFVSVLYEGKQMTATEVAQRHAEKLQQLGPVIERIQSEALDIIIDRTYAIMDSFGMIPEPPEEIQGKEWRVVYTGILAQAQQMVGTPVIEQLLGFGAQAAAVKPEALDKLNFDEALDLYAEKLGAAPSLVNSDEEVARIRAARAQQMQQQQTMEQAPNVAQGAKHLSDAKMEGDSALDALMGNLR